MYANLLLDKERARVSQTGVVQEKQVSDQSPSTDHCRRSPQKLPDICSNCPGIGLSPLWGDWQQAKLNSGHPLKTEARS